MQNGLPASIEFNSDVDTEEASEAFRVSIFKPIGSARQTKGRETRLTHGFPVAHLSVKGNASVC